MTRLPFPPIHTTPLIVSWWQSTRLLSSSIKFDASTGELGEILARHLQPKDTDPPTRQRILTTRREALNLYRSILRHTSLFIWTDPQGRLWRDVIRESARREFDQNKSLNDPETINRLIFSGNEAINQAMERYMAKREEMIKAQKT